MIESESELQISCVEYLGWWSKGLGLLWTISPITKLSAAQGAKQKRMGYVPGTPDLTIFSPSNGFHALMIEFKTAKGVQSKAQKDWQCQAEARGYKYAIIRSIDDFPALLSTYFLPKNNA
jgi:hypothetical protein